MGEYRRSFSNNTSVIKHFQKSSVNLNVFLNPKNYADFFFNETKKNVYVGLCSHFFRFQVVREQSSYNLKIQGNPNSLKLYFNKSL